MKLFLTILIALTISAELQPLYEEYLKQRPDSKISDVEWLLERSTAQRLMNEVKLTIVEMQSLDVSPKKELDKFKESIDRLMPKIEEAVIIVDKIEEKVPPR